MDLAWLLLAGAVALGVLAFSSIELVDDAYISFRYSHNLAEGSGLVFNPGEYVEGYTSLLWMLLMALPELLDVPVHLFAVYAGLAFGLLALLETWRALGVLEVNGWPRGLAVLAMGAYPEFWLASTMGLEGGLFAYLLALAARLLFSGKMARAGLVGGLMFATRPESLLLIGVVALYVLFVAKDDRRGFARLLRLGSPWLGLVAAVTLWRLYYYGAWLPNTISAKAPPEHSSGILLANALAATGYTAGFALAAAPLVAGMLLALVFAPRNRAIWLCVGAVAAELAVVLLNSGDWMLHHRLLSVFAPFLALSLGVALERLSSWRDQGVRLGAKWAATLLLALSAAAMLATPWWEATPDAKVAKVVPCWEALGDAAGDGLLPGDVVAPEALGYFSYANPEAYSHDIFGLTDRHVALYGDYYLPQFGKIDASYTYNEIRPDLMVSLTGTWGFLGMIANTGGAAYAEDYRTYQLSEGLNEAPSCQHWLFVVAIREEHVSRILPTFAEFNPQPVYSTLQ